MEVQSTRLGILNISKKDIITFQNGILGFPESKDYVWVQNIEPGMPIECLQCMLDEQLTFLIADPFLFAPDYEFELNKETKEMLDISSEEQVVIRVILTARPDSHTTINLRAPLIINVRNNQAAQVILDGPQYQLQYSIGRD